MRGQQRAGHESDASLEMHLKAFFQISVMRTLVRYTPFPDGYAISPYMFQYKTNKPKLRSKFVETEGIVATLD